LIRFFRLASLGVILLSQVTISMAQTPIIQPGAPGETTRALSAEEAIKIANTSHSPADTQFMQDMIPHHHQAIEMAELVGDRTNRSELIDAVRPNTARCTPTTRWPAWLRRSR